MTQRWDPPLRNDGHRSDARSFHVATGLVITFLFRRNPGLSRAGCRTLVVKAARAAIEAENQGPASALPTRRAAIDDSASDLFRLLLGRDVIELRHPLRQETFVAVVQHAADVLLGDGPEPTPGIAEPPL